MAATEALKSAEANSSHRGATSGSSMKSVSSTMS